ncbi:MAG TPA: [Fe-Fe] hydrogenase large subunit C-terminal domain-containing protein [Bacteroidales bacterium]|nr:[Fe-Fe] hydrogenase large subunit C-terminal domain-containing protein [Bacteroidales bacterium]HPT01902.1 [Fe-Fe] hydrogenase large subunit C-terminal domain-containing protein [Bacteroidales bacterium]
MEDATLNINQPNPGMTKLVFTVKEKCKLCYTCVRECPAKAIRITGGQAEVITERCIACGNCVKVCSQNAKVFRREIDPVTKLIQSGAKVIAMVAPSFPAEFSEVPDHRLLVGMIRQLGFRHVLEVAFGADLVARKYKEQLNSGIPAISSDCPAIVSFIERYYPELAGNLAEVVSPMVAMARVARSIYGVDSILVFIGPCLAKKAESKEIDNALTFRELREMFDINRINLKMVLPSEFDPPLSGRGAIFPLSHGLLNTMEVTEDILSENVLVAGGKPNFADALREFEQGNLKGHHIHLLCCEGCIMGPGMSPYLNTAAASNRFAKKAAIIRYANAKMATINREEWQENVDEYSKLDLSRTFKPNDMRVVRPSNEEIRGVMYRMGKYGPGDYLNCGACGYDSCEEHAIAIISGLAETEMCLPFSIERLHKYIRELNISNEKLATVQEALRHSEKLAGMGQLSAGIAHELNNPLGVITMYSNILREEVPAEDPIQKDLELIVEQADRCRKIVGGLLNFARKNQVNIAETDVVKLAEHSINSVIVPTDVTLGLENHLRDRTAMLDFDQMTQVLTNLIKNSIEAMPDGGKITLGLTDTEDKIMIRVTDNGTGIPAEHMDKLYTPFFTTKAIGKGTGLGLPIIYGIVKMHKGDIKVESNADPSAGATGTTFTLIFPRQRAVIQ